MPNREGWLWRALEAIADYFIVGLLTTVASLPVVTALPALSAASAVLGSEDRPTSLVRSFSTAFTARVRTGIPLSIACLLLLAVAAADVTWALSQPLTALRTLVLAAGLLLALAVGATAAQACALLHRRAPLRAIVTAAAMAAAVSPLRALVPAVLAALAVPVALVVPLVVPFALAVLARVLSWSPAPVLRPARALP